MDQQSQKNPERVFTSSPAEQNQFSVLSFSRDILRTLGFTAEQIGRLTDEDLCRLADSIGGKYLAGFYETLKLQTSLLLVEKHWPRVSSQKEEGTD